MNLTYGLTGPYTHSTSQDLINLQKNNNKIHIATKLITAKIEKQMSTHNSAPCGVVEERVLRCDVVPEEKQS